jgi:Arc/MetJ-type ribon-helix-helix transcriptional regulator
MKTTERITVSLPTEVAERLRTLADAGAIDSVSAYVADAVDGKLRREHDLARLEAAFAARGIAPTSEADAWVQQVVGEREQRERAA